MLLPDEIVMDFFAGGGGASQGIARAIGRSVDVAINHDPEAIEMHRANHPTTRHLLEDVWKVNIKDVTRGRKVGLAWFSPDCKHFSRAKGSKPVNKNIRSLAWIAVRTAKECSPRIIVIENVREFEDWGPLVPCWLCSGCGWKGTEGQAILSRGGKHACPRCESKKLVQTEDKYPDPARKGLTFKRFVGQLRNLGYHCEWKVLNAADFGAPTHRRRLFLIARNDGEPVNWPEPTHGDPKKLGTGLFDAGMKSWRTAAECIDWDLRCPSIFERRKPLAEKTLRRIALGIKRYVLDNPRPFVVGVGGRAGQTPPTSADAPLGTVTSKNDRAVVTPVVVPVTHAGERRAYTPEEPLPVITGANRGELALATPVIAHLAHGNGKTGRWKDGTRASSVEAPVGTVHAGGGNFALTTPIIARLGQGGGNGKYVNGADEPLTTLVSKNEHLAVAPILYPRNGEFPGQTPRCQTVEQPLNTVTVDGNCGQLATAILVGAGGPDYSAKPREADRPLGTLTAEPRSALATANLIRMNHGEKQWNGVDEPHVTVTSANHSALVAAFIAKHYGERPGSPPGSPADSPLPTTTERGTQNQLAVANLLRFNHDDAGLPIDAPTPTVTTNNHAALVYSFLTKYFGTAVGVEVDSPLPTATGKDRFGLVTVTIDGEPYVIVDIGMRMLTPRELSRAQGFAPNYIMTGSKTSQVARIGNSVPPDLAEAVVAANVVEVGVCA